MKILFCLSCYDPSFFYREIYYSRGLAKMKDMEVSVLTSTVGCVTKATGFKTYPEGETVQEKVCVIRKKPLFRLKDLLYFPFAREIDRIQPDVVHIIEARNPMSLFVARYCKKKGIPVVYDHEQRCEGSTFFGKLRWKLWTRPALKYICQNAAVLRAVTPAGVRALQKAGGPENENKIYLSSWAYDKSLFYLDPQTRKSVRRELKISEDQLLITCTGKFETNKKMECLLKAMKACKRKDLVFLMVGVGPQPYFDEIRQTFEDGEKIRFIPRFVNNQELNEIYNAADYGIWPAPTISTTQALGSGLHIIIPYGGTNAGLTLDGVHFFGKDGGIQFELTHIEDEEKVQGELESIFSNLDSYNRKVDPKILKREKGHIAEVLAGQYQESVLSL